MNTAERESIEIDAVALAMEVVRPYIRRMSSPSRRKFCADMAARYFDSTGKKTGRFFNQLRRADGWKEEDPRELGRRIMAKRNPHYKPEEGKN